MWAWNPVFILGRLRSEAYLSEEVLLYDNTGISIGKIFLTNINQLAKLKQNSIKIHDRLLTLWHINRGNPSRILPTGSTSLKPLPSRGLQRSPQKLFSKKGFNSQYSGCFKKGG